MQAKSVLSNSRASPAGITKPPFFVFLIKKEKRKFYLNRAARTLGLVNLVSYFLFQPVFSCEHLFIDKPMVKTKPTVPRARLLGPGKKNAENAQQGSYSSHAESFWSSPKSRKRKEVSAGRCLKFEQSRQHQLMMFHGLLKCLK